jgi:hypothetical protein
MIPWGRLYALVTRYLGMAPLEHEYKVMGLAPYVSSNQRIKGAARDFSGLFEFASDGLFWTRRAGVPSMYAAYGFLKKSLDGKRFDTIPAGVQRFIELVKWVSNAIRETGIRKVACSGGVFMNVKGESGFARNSRAGGSLRISRLRLRIEQHRRGLSSGGLRGRSGPASGRALLWRADHRRARDAVDVFLRSGLRCMARGNWWVEKV